VPVLTVIARPNGSGKSTLIQRLEFEGREHLLDPDAVARNIDASNPREAAISAARFVLTLTRDYFDPRIELCSGNNALRTRNHETHRRSQDS